jgi:hypothetical protein
MRASTLAGLAAIAITMTVACGSDSSPTAPDGSNTLTIVPATDFLAIGSTVTLAARLTETGSPPRVVSADWSTDDGRVASVDRQGLVSALGSGSTTIRATFEGRTAAQALRVAPDFAGTWIGARRVVACVHPSPTFCTTNYPVAQQFATRLVLSQVKASVSGTLQFMPPAASPAATLTGEISSTGQLPLVGTIGTSTSGGPVTLVGSINDWRSQIDAVQAVMLGSFTEQRLDSNGTAWRVSWELLGLTRVP